MNLADWAAISDPTTRKIACVGDSTTEIGWAQVLREIMAHRWGYGGFGVRHMGKEWTQAGTPTKASNSDLWNIGFHINGFSPNLGTWRMNNSSDIWTWTKPPLCPPVTGFKLLMADGPSSANFAYRIDGGSWTNVSQTWAQNNTLKQITVNTAVTSTVDVRGANAAGTTVLTYICGIEPLCASTGVKVHDVSASGGFSNGVIRTANPADWTQWFLQEQPQIVFVTFVNDVVNSFWVGGQPASYQAKQEALAAVVESYGGIMIPYSYYEFGDGVDPTVANQTDKHARELAVAQAHGGYYYDLKALYGTRTTVVGNGIIFASDLTHPTPKGSRLMANHAWNLIGNQSVGKKKVRL